MKGCSCTGTAQEDGALRSQESGALRSQEDGALRSQEDGSAPFTGGRKRSVTGPGGAMMISRRQKNVGGALN